MVDRIEYPWRRPQRSNGESELFTSKLCRNYYPHVSCLPQLLLPNIAQACYINEHGTCTKENG